MLVVKNGQREFFVKETGKVYADPNPAMEPKAVLSFLAAMDATLLNSNISGPEWVKDKLRFTIKIVIGTKG